MQRLSLCIGVGARLEVVDHHAGCALQADIAAANDQHLRMQQAKRQSVP